MLPSVALSAQQYNRRNLPCTVAPLWSKECSFKDVATPRRYQYFGTQVMFVPALLCTVVPHLYLEPTYAKTYINKWKPESMEFDKVKLDFASVASKQYADAVIAVRASVTTGAIVRVDSTPCIFVVTCNENVVLISASIMDSNACPVQIMDDLREWLLCASGEDIVLIDSQLEDPTFLDDTI